MRRARSLTLVPVEREIAYSVSPRFTVYVEPELDELEHPATIRLPTNIIKIEKRLLIRHSALNTNVHLQTRGNYHTSQPDDPQSLRFNLVY